LSVLWFVPGLLGIFLEVLLVGAMRRTGAHRRYRLLFVFCLLLLCSAVVETAASLSPNGSFVLTQQYRLFYWTNESIFQFLTFLLMISLIHRALDGIRIRAALCLFVALAVILVVGTFVGFSGVTFTNYRWMTPLSRNLSFCSALLNFVLWSALLRQRRRDPQLLTVCAGLGLATTGKAIGHSLRKVSTSSVVVGDLLIVVTSLLCLYLWWYAFSKMRPPDDKPSKPRKNLDASSAEDLNATLARLVDAEFGPRPTTPLITSTQTSNAVSDEQMEYRPGS
jgi:hypothetical protein